MGIRVIVAAFVVLTALGTGNAQHPEAGKAKSPQGAAPATETTSAFALWGAAADDVWAVGRAGAAWRWNGARWSRVELPSRASFESIWGRAADDIWIAGAGTAADQAAVLHWDGRVWSDMHFPQARVEIVGGSDDDGVWVATHDGAVWSWSDGAWKQRVTPRCRTQPCPGQATCGGSCMWARFHTAGGGLLIQPPPWSGFWDGRALVRGRKPPPAHGRTFGGARVSSLLLESGPLSDRSSWSEVRRWNGSRWTALGTRRGPPWIPRGLHKEVTVRALWGASDDDVWAVGTGGTILHWNGSTWRSFDADTGADLMYLWGIAANDIWASGGDHPVSSPSAQAGPTVLLHWDGTRWVQVEAPWHRPR